MKYDGQEYIGVTIALKVKQRATVLDEMIPSLLHLATTILPRQNSDFAFTGTFQCTKHCT